mgnify:CR=1 FL=1
MSDPFDVDHDQAWSEAFGIGASHLRVGTFQFAAATGDQGLLRRLVAYAIDRHHPVAAES